MAMRKMFLCNQSRRFYTDVKMQSCLPSSLDYCIKIVRQHDYENFMATLLLKESIRSPALVVRAFNVEVARVQDQTTDPKTAEFRLHFWLETLQKIFRKDQEFKHIPANPIAQELYKVSRSSKLSKRNLERLIKSRNEYLKSKYFNTIEELEKYAEDTVSTIYYSTLNIAEVNNLHADHAASHLGKAQGLTNLLRSVQVSNKHKMVSLPMEVLVKHGVSQEDVLRGSNDKKMESAVFDIASRAKMHLDKARSITLPKDTSQIFLPAAAVDIYLKRLQRRNFNIYDKSLQQRSATLPLILYYNNFMQKF